MQIQLLRNALLKLTYAGRTLLIDPDLGAKHSRPSFTGRSQNPMVDLPEPIESILAGVDQVIVSHLHADHFDAVAKERIPKELPVLCQPGDEETIRAAGFTNVTPLEHFLRLGPIVITRQPAQHGTGAVVEKMGKVMGLTFEAPGEPTLYWCGDSVLYPPLRDAVAATAPEVIVSHSCGAKWDDTLIVMDAEQTLELCETHPAAVVIATHMEALDHATVSRAALRQAAQAHGIGEDRLRIPADGETIEIRCPAPAGA
ncbi:MAG TPA: MBL fold metallo-hydrolase [Bosea sp. (in: a-proteobacteria)]|jgi:L-ascorbate metabolism protein UlaG (beta-lactamase superfamily)|uniref:MBL fold metallo-hydrolase n=1 Tax=Bosea sp. (in: a-proteobacteria) TaxID=1871050 RepID=UPI002E139D2C|nr:MBL fold metallo-hydrolase [Bosea sp. (in: a-proteobacteria)]